MLKSPFGVRSVPIFLKSMHYYFFGKGAIRALLSRSELNITGLIGSGCRKGNRHEFKYGCVDQLTVRGTLSLN